ncbi:hypothetical protein BG006_002098 [Podila minutissima]|uniref:Dynamin N-terminal domain-containing protein n=1 Tax=Podila minutissima TaxID=64525 RepID=A0A9P5VGX3_9FUNG|nr:hypothetical protein BG006_002098 [Podila minutissima]
MEELTKAEVYEAEETPFDKIKEIYLRLGGVYDTDPCKPAETPAEAPIVFGYDYEGSLQKCDFCGEGECNKSECKTKLAYFSHIYDGDNESNRSCRTGSVLMFGKTQAGKSTFIECIRNYSSSRYDIDESLLGTGVRSKTREPVQLVVTSNLPAYEVFDSNEMRIDINALGDKHQDPEDYLDALNDRKTTLRPVPHNPGTLLPFVEITFLDTPGIKDTNGRDVEHAPKIIEAMARMKSFNLIIIIINCKDTPSISHQLAFNYYSKVIHTFQGHHSNIVFLYTHVDYEKCHHSNIEHLSVMRLQHKAFSQLFRCRGSYNHEDVANASIEPYLMYNIDFAKSQRPVARCMRLMTLRKILTHAVSSPPVALDISWSNLQRIKEIPHPDKLNKTQRSKILEATRILDQRQEGSRDSSDAPAVSSKCSRALEDNVIGAVDGDRATDLSTYGREDWIGYFPETIPDCSGSREEADGCSDGLDSGISMGTRSERTL